MSVCVHVLLSILVEHLHVYYMRVNTNYCVLAYECLYVCMYNCRALKYMFMCLCLYLCVYCRLLQVIVNIYIQMCVSVYIYICIYIYIHLHLYICIHIYIRANTNYYSMCVYICTASFPG